MANKKVPGDQIVDTVSRQAVMWMLTNLSYTQCRTQGEAEVIGLAKTMLIAMPSAQEGNNSNQELNNSTATDCISRQAAIDECNKRGAEHIGYAIAHLPSAQPEPMSESYMKAVWTWLLDYQIKTAELKGKYTPYEVLSWVANDWRKEHE